ncbi:DUF3368 domain-containing protein [Candidatus Halobeggiatoa sp. HSG11]|nr:DUF3368 domain-containing protein [Candidatus Halobeggiatoa sp. HSG11]
MILIADSSALVALSVCDSLILLEQLFNDVIVPNAVFEEVTKSDKPEAQELKSYLIGKVCKVDMSHFIYLDSNIDIGETEAMLLYKQKSADRLLIDDKKGRKVAKINGINVIDSLGILLSAKQAGLISKIKPKINDIAKSRMYINQSLINLVLELAGEDC